MIRVIRVLEYEYDTQEHMDKDLSRWYVPPQGVSVRPRQVIRSSVTLPYSIAPEEAIRNEGQKYMAGWTGDDPSILKDSDLMGPSGWVTAVGGNDEQAADDEDYEGEEGEEDLDDSETEAMQGKWPQAEECKEGGCQIPLIGEPTYDHDEPIYVCEVGKCRVAAVHQQQATDVLAEAVQAGAGEPSEWAKAVHGTWKGGDEAFIQRAEELKTALQRIINLDGRAGRPYLDEWTEAESFHGAQKIAREALGVDE